ncbi:MAG: Hsp20/alpha crystallin family protein [Caldicoprobacterales bacterium]|jgi:HSP20 family protein|nr:Hsp20/alpha crystallin family protein [Clostridiales bacterium]
MFGLTPINRRNTAASRWPGSFFDVDSWFDNFFSSSFRPSLFGFDNQMKVDIKDNGNSYTIEVDMPGADKNDIHVELNNNILTIGVQKNEITEEERKNYIRKERMTSTMSRSFRVENVKPEDVKARFKNGVLSVTLPKSEAKNDDQHRIQID